MNKKAPMIGLVVIALALTASVAYAYNLALQISASVNVVPVTTYWTSTTTSIDVGDLMIGTTSPLSTITITNASPTAQVLGVSATSLGTGLTLVVKTLGDATYAPTSVAAGGSITLKIGVAASESATLGTDNFVINFETII